MKRKLLFLAFLIISLSRLYSQESIIFNKDYAWSKDDKSVTVHFDLAPYEPNTFYKVSLIATLNGKKVKVSSVKGDVGKYIESGENKRITWDITADLGELKTTDVLTVDVVARKVKTRALGKSSHKLPKILAWSSIGIGALTAGYGVYMEKQASDDFEIYKNNEASSPIYAELGTTRDELYNDANSRHKTAQALMIAGGAAVLTGAAILIFKKSAPANENVSLVPVVIPHFAYNGSVKPRLNVIMTMRF